MVFIQSEIRLKFDLKLSVLKHEVVPFVSQFSNPKYQNVTTTTTTKKTKKKDEEEKERI